MARYYIVILIINILIALFLYFKVKISGLSSKVFIYIAGLSVLIGIIFPLLVGYFNMYTVVGINLFIIGLGVYCITQFTDRAEKTGDDSSSDIQEGENMSAERPCFEDPSDLLNSYVLRGFAAKTAGKPDLAVKYFTSALELSPPLDLSIMLIFDVFSMLKEIGQYQKAKESLEQFAEENSPGLSSSVIREIKANLKYIEVLQEMLIKANTPALPFSAVPALIRVSVEEKVNEWESEAF